MFASFPSMMVYFPVRRRRGGAPKRNYQPQAIGGQAMAEKEAKIITPEGLIRDPAAIFDDLDKLRVESEITIERQTIIASCRCGKPDPNVYFRSHPSVSMRLAASLIRHKQERDLY